jgi:tRNA (guanine26-N2/guanine27-N2)-dimethyltransferase
MPSQVINRDLSIAVLRYFVRQRAGEVASGKLKRPRRLLASGKAVAAVPAAAASPAQPQPSAAAAERPAPTPKSDDEPSTSGAKEPWDGKIRILEGLAASGLRSIRYALEASGSIQIASFLLLVHANILCLYMQS